MLNLLLTLHILSAVWLMGHQISSAFWKARADRSEIPKPLQPPPRHWCVQTSHSRFPESSCLLGTGIWMAGLTGWERFQELWLGTSFFLVIVMVIIWLAILLPQQRRMARFAAEIPGRSRPGRELPAGQQALEHGRRYHDIDPGNSPVPDGIQALSLTPHSYLLEDNMTTARDQHLTNVTEIRSRTVRDS